MTKLPNTYFSQNKASKRKSSVQRYNGKYVCERKLHGELSKNCNVHNYNKPMSANSVQLLREYTSKCLVSGNKHRCRRTLKKDNLDNRKKFQIFKSSDVRIRHITYPSDSNKKSFNEMEIMYPHENKCLVSDVNNYKLNFLNKDIQQKCRTLSSKLTKHKKKVLFKSNNNSSSEPSLSILYLSKTMTHSSKSLQNQQVKDTKIYFPETDMKQCSDRKSILRFVRDDDEKFRLKKLGTERYPVYNPGMSLYGHMPKYVYTTLQSQLPFYNKRIHSKPKSTEIAIENFCGVLPERNNIEIKHVIKNQVSNNDHLIKSISANHNTNTQRCNIYKDKTGIKMLSNKKALQCILSRSQCLQIENKMDIKNIFKRYFCRAKLHAKTEKVKGSSPKRKEQNPAYLAKFKKVNIVHSYTKNQTFFSSTLNVSKNICMAEVLDDKTNKSGKKQYLDTTYVADSSEIITDIKMPFDFVTLRKPLDFISGLSNKSIEHSNNRNVMKEKISSMGNISNNYGDLEHCLSKLSIKQLNRITTNVNKKRFCSLIVNTDINTGHDYAKEYNNFYKLRHPYMFNNNEHQIVKSPFFQKFYAFNVKVSPNPKKSTTSSLESNSYESGLNKINKLKPSNYIKNRNSCLNAIKVTAIKMPKHKGFVSIPKAKYAPEPKKATISSVKFKHHLKSIDNRHPSQNDLRSFDFNAQISKNKRKNRQSHKQLTLSQSIHTTKKKNKRVTCAKGGIKGIYIQYKGTWGRPMSKSGQRRPDGFMSQGTKLKTKHSYTKPSALQNKRINANVENKKKDVGTKHVNIFSDVVSNKDQQLKTYRFMSYKNNHKLESGQSFTNFFTHKPKSIKALNVRKAFLPRVSNLNNMPKIVDASKIKMVTMPNRVSTKTKNNLRNKTIVNSKERQKSTQPANRNEITSKVPHTHAVTKKTNEKYYGKTPILRRCFYALGLKNKNRSEKVMYRKMKKRQDQFSKGNNLKHKSMSISSITKHVSKGISPKNHLEKSLINKNNRRSLNNIIQPLDMTTLSLHKKRHREGLLNQEGTRYSRKGNNNFKSDHDDDVHQYYEVNNKSISLRNNNVEDRPERLKCYQSKTRNCVKRKRRDEDYTERNNSLQLNKNNKFRTMQTLVDKSKRKQLSNETDLSKGDNTTCSNKNSSKRYNFCEDKRPKVCRSPSTYSDGSIHNAPIRVRKKHNIFSDNMRTKNDESTYVPAVSRTLYRAQERHSIIRQCINKFGLQRHCIEAKIANINSECIKSSTKNNRVAKSRPTAKLQRKDDVTSKNKEFPHDYHATEPSMLKVSNKSKNKKYKDCKPENAASAVNITDIEPSMLKTNIKSAKSDIKKNTKHEESQIHNTNIEPSVSITNIKSVNSDLKKNRGVKSRDMEPQSINTYNIEPSMSKTKKGILKLSFKQKAGRDSICDITTCESPTCHKSKVDIMKHKRGSILNSARSTWNSITNFTTSSLINVIKKVMKPRFKQKSDSEKIEQDTGTNTLKLQIKKETKCPSRNVECQIDSKKQTVKLHFKPKKVVASPPYHAPRKSFTYFKHKIQLRSKRRRGTKLREALKPTCKLRTCDTESNITPLLKNINRSKPLFKRPNAATKAALAELHANDPTLPKSVKDPLIKLIVDKNTMNVLNRDEIIYGLGSRRNESGAVKQGRLALQNKLIKAPVMDLIINRDDARIVGTDTNTTSGSRFKKDVCRETLCARTKGKKESKFVRCMKSPTQSGKKNRLPCIYQCPECLKIRGRRTDRTKVFREPKTAAMVSTERVLDYISNTMLGWVGRSHCVCGTTVCKKEREKIEQEKRKQRIKIKPCTCGSYECESAMAKKYHKHKIKRGKRKYKALKQKRIEKQKERQRTHRENALAKEKNKLVTMDKADLQKQYAKEDAWAIKRRKKKEKEALKRVEKFKNANDFFLLAESVMDIGKLGICVVFKLLKSSISAISNPKLTARRLKIAARDPHRALYRMSQSCKGSEASAIIKRMHRRSRVMKTVIFFKTAMQSNPVTNYLLNIRDPQKRLRKIRKQRDPLDYECSLYMGSLRKRPCLWVYYLCPWFYPHCVSLVGIWRQFTDILLFILAVGVWSPCIICTELCRALMCCCLCSA